MHKWSTGLYFATVASLAVVGCSVRVDRSFDVDAGAEPAGCVCEVAWIRIVTPGEVPIRCTPRGECAADAACVLVLPLTEEPTCALR